VLASPYRDPRVQRLKRGHGSTIDEHMTLVNPLRDVPSHMHVARDDRAGWLLIDFEDEVGEITRLPLVDALRRELGEG
jgi:hypothetical protein